MYLHNDTVHAPVLQSAAHDTCLFLAAAQVFATSLNAYFQLTIMLMVLVIGMAGLAYYHPFEDPSAQGTQVCGYLDCFSHTLCRIPSSTLSDMFVSAKQLLGFDLCHEGCELAYALMACSSRSYLLLKELLNICYMSHHVQTLTCACRCWDCWWLLPQPQVASTSWTQMRWPPMLA